MQPHRSSRRCLAALVAASLLAGACGSDDDTSAATTSAPSTTELPLDDEASERTADVDDGEEDPAAVADDAAVIEVQVAGDAVTGGGRHQVPLGRMVTVRVTSDVTDHIHVHGYDLFEDVAAGEEAEITFEATIPGIFEIELEDAHLLLVELEVS